MIFFSVIKFKCGKVNLHLEPCRGFADRKSTTKMKWMEGNLEQQLNNNDDKEVTTTRNPGYHG